VETEKIRERFEKLKADYHEFTGSFSGWGVVREAANNEEIDQLNKDIAALEVEVNELSTKLGESGVITGIGFFIFACGFLCGPFAPFVIVSGHQPCNSI
jgi:hypothetical protein